MLKTALPVILVLVNVLLSGAVMAQEWSQVPACPQEGIKRSCGSSVGECEKGERTCIVGEHGLRWSEECVGGIEPVDEIPGNGLDDNCDGLVDEGGFSLFSIILMGTGAAFIVIALILAKME